MNLFGEDCEDTPEYTTVCCDVCEEKSMNEEIDTREEIEILYDAIGTIGNKGELKLTQWIRGSCVAWTNTHNKTTSLSYSNFKRHSKHWWRLFIKKCNVLGLVKKDLKSIVKQSQHYCIQAIVYKTAQGQSTLEEGQSVFIPAR